MIEKVKVKIIYEGELGIEGNCWIGCPFWENPEHCRDEDNVSGVCDARYCRHVVSIKGDRK